jgi:hypothetical protein
MGEATSAIQDLIDRQAIFDCLKRLARGMDRHDVEVMRASYHRDGHDDHGAFSGNAYDAIDWLNGSEVGPGAHDSFFCTQHHLCNHLAEIDGDTAHSETYYLFAGRLRADNTLLMAGGRYIDRLERREDGVWRIAVRRVAMDWTTKGGDAPDLTTPSNVFVPSTWDRTDISYQRPLTVPPSGTFEAHVGGNLESEASR